MYVAYCVYPGPRQSDDLSNQLADMGSDIQYILQAFTELDNRMREIEDSIGGEENIRNTSLVQIVSINDAQLNIQLNMIQGSFKSFPKVRFCFRRH